MPVDKIRRGAVSAKVGFPNANAVRIDPTTDTLRFGTSTSGTTEKQGVDTSSVQTLTNKTLTAPTITAPVISGAGTVSAQINADVKALAADFTANSGGTGATLTPITGMSWSVVAGGTYRLRLRIPKITQTTNGGSKMAFKLTTATLASVNLRVKQSTDTDNTGAVSTNFTSTADEATWFDQKAVVYTYVEVEGTFVTTLAGTIAIEAAQNTSHADTTTIVLGAHAELTRVA